MKFQYRIALMQFMIGTLIIVFGVIAYRQFSSKTLDQQAHNDLQKSAHQIAHQVDFLLHEKAEKIKALASAPIVEKLLRQSNVEYATYPQLQRDELISKLNQQWMESDDKKSSFIQSYLKNPVANYFMDQFDLQPEEYGEIFLTNSYGALVASTEKLTTLAHGHKYWWQESFNDGQGKIYFDDRGFDASVKGYVLGIVVPVIKGGQIIGILKSNVRIQGALEDIVRCSSSEHFKTMIVRDEGNIVLECGHTPLSTEINPEIKSKLKLSNKGSLTFDEGSRPLYAAFFKIPLSQGGDQYGFGGKHKSIDQSQGNQDEGWNIVVTHTVADALQLFRETSRYFYILNIVVVFLLAFTALWIGRKVAKPLKQFSATASQIGQGDFNVRLEVTSQDEFGEVAQSFNEMSNKLSATMATKEEYFGEIQQRKLVEKALMDSERGLKSAQYLAKLGSWDLDLVTGSLSWSDEVYRIFDLVPQQFVATYEAFLDNIHPEDRELVDNAYTESVLNKVPYDIVHRLLLADGALKYVNERCETTFDNDGKPIRSIGTVQDITESVLAEQQQQELETQLRQKHKMEAVGYMAGGMAHNFNNNLGIILGNVELSQMKQPVGSDVIPLLENAKIAVRRSRDLVKNIITYSRQGNQQKAPMQLTTITDETITLMQPTLPSTVNLQKSYGSDCDSTSIDADASQIQEVLINLCNNAIQAMDEKGDLKILIEPVDLKQQEIPAQYDCLPGRYAKLSVQDSGCGISPKILDKIFDPFFSTKEEYEGAGMGLATVQGIVVQHGGFIKVNSIPDRGAVFNLYFPVIEQTHVDQPTVGNTTLPRGTERILFVDDDEMLAHLGEKLLTEMGYQVVVMTESTEALKMFAVNSEHFDLVITDQTMPQLSGKDLIEELKKIKPDIPTILCTGYSNKIDEAHAKELGISAFMMKPLNLIQLTQTVRRVLDGVEIE